ncbi:hypothetical protein JCM3774_003341 [Rhodotorula dairenensis]
MNATAVDPVCEDLCYGILENLPSRALVQIRGTSRVFADLVDEILRSRFLNVISGRGNELVLESCPPYATRGAHRQPLVFSHFSPAAAAADCARTGDVAHMRTKATGPERVPYYLPLDDGEVFANNQLAIHLRQRDSMSLWSDDEDEADDRDGGGGGGGSTIRLARPLQPRGFGYLNSIQIAASLDRFFRSWFVDPASEPDWSAAWSPSAPSTPTSSPESTPWTSRESSPSPQFGMTATAGEPKRSTRPRRIRATSSSHSALHGAQIECVQVPASEIEFNHPDIMFYSSTSPAGSSPPGSRFHASPTSTPRLYEYFFDSVELDVAKVVVAAEENMPSSVRSGRGASTTAPYIFIL